VKKLLIIAVSVALVMLAGCGSLPVTDLASGVMAAGKGVQAAAQVAEAVDFRSGEVLASDGTDSNVESMSYYVSKVVTPATAATKQQAKVLFIENGKEEWASFVIPTHKAAKAELTVGKLVFVLNNYRDYDAKNVSVDEYRKGRWVLERITSTDEMFKNRVEAGGDKFHPDLVRIPDIKLD